MSTFEEWWADSNFSCDEFDNSTRVIAKVVWNVKQYEIEELKAEIEELKDEAANQELLIDDMRHHNEELQEKVDMLQKDVYAADNYYGDF